jgi:hypothetical protein
VQHIFLKVKIIDTTMIKFLLVIIGAPSPPPPVMTVGVPESCEEDTDPQELLMMFDEVQDIQMNTSGGDGDHTPRAMSTDQTLEPAVQPYL